MVMSITESFEASFAVRSHILDVVQSRREELTIMSIASRPTGLETTRVRVALEDAVFEPQALEAALQQALFEMLDGANLVAPGETRIWVSGCGSRGLALTTAIDRQAPGAGFVAPCISADQLRATLLGRDPIEVSAAWAKSRIPAWACSLRPAASLEAASALIWDDVREALAAAAPAGKSRRRASIGTWLRRHLAESKAGADGLPCLIGRLDAAGGARCLPSFSLEMSPRYRIPKDGEFLALGLHAFTWTRSRNSADADVEIIGRVTAAAAAAFLAARCGARRGPRVWHEGRQRRVDSLIDVLALTLRTSGLFDDQSFFCSHPGLRVVVDGDAGTMRLGEPAEPSAHEKAAILRGIRRPPIVRDPADFMPRDRVLGIDHCVAVAALDALIENEERLAARAPRGWRAKALEQALRTLARPARDESRLVNDWEGLLLLREHCRRTARNINVIMPPKAVSDGLREAHAAGIDFPAELRAAAERRARLPADHPDRLWMITRRRAAGAVRRHAVVGPDLREVPIHWLQTTLRLDDAVDGDRLSEPARV
jgi:hypothetical protein